MGVGERLKPGRAAESRARCPALPAPAPDPAPDGAIVTKFRIFVNGIRFTSAGRVFVLDKLFVKLQEYFVRSFRETALPCCICKYYFLKSPLKYDNKSKDSSLYYELSRKKNQYRFAQKETVCAPNLKDAKLFSSHLQKCVFAEYTKGALPPVGKRPGRAQLLCSEVHGAAAAAAAALGAR